MIKAMPLWFQIFGGKILPIALIALWGIPVFALFQLSKGAIEVGTMLLLVWVPMFIWVVVTCHRRDLVRVWVSLVSTVFVLILFAGMFWRIL